MRASLRTGLAVAALLVVPEAAIAGEFGIPCDPGSFSASGFEPCTACVAGTFTIATGADHCDACPAGTAASLPGASSCFNCSCDDHVVCTRDLCDAVSAACSAEPVPTCAPVTIGFEGTITDIPVSEGEHPISLGMSMQGHYVFDPLAPDTSPGSPGFGAYEGALIEFAIRVGTGASAIEANATTGDLYVSDHDVDAGDAYQVLADSLTGPAIPGFDQRSFLMFLSRGDDALFASDAIPLEPPDPAAFPEAFARLTLQGGGDTVFAVSEDFTLSAPEPTASDLSIAVLAVLAGLARSRRSFVTR